ncbi:MAG: AAA family ATPase [[Clostridium] scindens]
MSKRVITIGRQFGSDGRIIGNALAAKLGINCYDKELIKLASEQIDIPYEQLKRVDEKREKPWSYQVDLDSGLDRRYRYEHIDEKLFETQSDVILKLAEREDCIIVGRCADYVLKDCQTSRHVFLYAPYDDRIRTVMERYSLDEKKAERTDPQGRQRQEPTTTTIIRISIGKIWRITTSAWIPLPSTENSFWISWRKSMNRSDIAIA